MKIKRGGLKQGFVTLYFFGELGVGYATDFAGGRREFRFPTVAIRRSLLQHSMHNCAKLTDAEYKQGIAELLQKRRDLIYDVFSEVLEDIALVNAIKEGENTEIVDRDQVFQILESKS